LAPGEGETKWRGHRVVSEAPTGWSLLDLHNHTRSSYDSSNRIEDYARAHADGLFDAVAITDHNTIEGAVALAERHGGDFLVIVGEEVDTAQGELIGLFLRDPLPVNESALATAEEIRVQGGLVYLQHPFYRFIRRRLGPEAMTDLAARGLIDVVEGLNGGPWMSWFDPRARNWAREHGLPCGAGSDAHHPGDIGRCGVAVRADGSELLDLTARSFLERLECGVLVDRRRPSLASVAARARYAISGRLGRKPLKHRVPQSPARS
jgi:predicted metal-dependent phosphoesterase TrpH